MSLGFTWSKRGLIYKPEPTAPHLISHASNPLAMHLEGDVYRVFYSGRDSANRSSVGYVDLNIVSERVVGDPGIPVAICGSEDSFYSHGISIGNMYESQGKRYVLFMGWQIPENEHWRGDIGRLRWKDDENMFEVAPEGAFMSTDEEDPISLSYAWVMYDQGVYKMWYGSTITWEAGNGEMLHVIKYATSPDAIAWTKHGVAIPYTLGEAQAFSRPTVFIRNGIHHMWYSYRDGRGTKYRIGYSNSQDGVSWTNHLERVGIDVSESGWDSEMICYPFVFEHNGELCMLYNGNDFGKFGFGLAKATLL